METKTEPKSLPLEIKIDEYRTFEKSSIYCPSCGRQGVWAQKTIVGALVDWCLCVFCYHKFTFESPHNSLFDDFNIKDTLKYLVAQGAWVSGE